MYAAKIGNEQAIHSLKIIFENTELETILLFDAKNGLKIPKWNLALKNIETFCVFLYPCICNSYCES